MRILAPIAICCWHVLTPWANVALAQTEVNRTQLKGELINDGHTANLIRNKAIDTSMPAGAPAGTIEARVIDSPNGVLNARDYGAKGDDSTDDTAALQNAIVAAKATSTRVMLPPGTYRYTAPLVLDGAVGLCGVLGADSLGSVLKRTNNAIAVQILSSNVELCDVTLTAVSPGTTSGLQIGTSSIVPTRLNLHGVVARGFGGTGVDIQGTIDSYIQVKAYGNSGDGVRLKSTGLADNINVNRIVVDSTGNAGYGFALTKAHGNEIMVTAQGNTLHGVFLNTSMNRLWIYTEGNVGGSMLQSVSGQLNEITGIFNEGAPTINNGAISLFDFYRGTLDVGVRTKFMNPVGINAEPLTPLYVWGKADSPANSGITPAGTAAFTSDNGKGVYIGSYTNLPLGVWIQTALRSNLATHYPIVLNPLGGAVQSASGWQDISTVAKQTCSLAARGTIYVEKGGTGVADQPFLCAKKSDDTYAWIQLSMVPLP